MPNIAQQLKLDPEGYKREAREWARRFAEPLKMKTIPNNTNLVHSNHSNNHNDNDNDKDNDNKNNRNQMNSNHLIDDDSKHCPNGTSTITKANPEISTKTTSTQNGTSETQNYHYHYHYHHHHLTSCTNE
jgi:hypothetical protein